MRINEQLILECVGKANRNGLGLRGKVRTKTQEISAKVSSPLRIRILKTLYILFKTILNMNRLLTVSYQSVL